LFLRLLAICGRREKPVLLRDWSPQTLVNERKQLLNPPFRGRSSSIQAIGNIDGKPKEKEDSAVSKIERAGIRSPLSILV
jgi:hypothetical protein